MTSTVSDNRAAAASGRRSKKSVRIICSSRLCPLKRSKKNVRAVLTLESGDVVFPLECGDVTPLLFFFLGRVETEKQPNKSGVTSPHSKRKQKQKRRYIAALQR